MPIAAREQLYRTAGAAGTAAAVGEQHRRGSGAMGRRLDRPVCCPDECHRTVAGHDPHPLRRPERLRRRDRVDRRRPGAHRRSGHAPAGVREHRRHTERDAAGRRHRAQHQHIARAQRLRRRQDRLDRRSRRLFSPFGPSAGSTASGRRSLGSCWASPATTVARRVSPPPPPWSTASRVVGLCQIYRNEPWHQELCPEVIDYGCTLGGCRTRDRRRSSGSVLIGRPGQHSGSKRLKSFSSTMRLLCVLRPRHRMNRAI